MPEWVTHMMVADSVLEKFPKLDRHGFYVGNVAPDCNIQNEDWTVYTPPREVTHWMQGERKAVSDCDAFCEAYIWKCRDLKKDKVKSLFDEEYSFLLGYYSHLMTDALFQERIRDIDRVAAAWKRIRADQELQQKLCKIEPVEENWDTVKRLIPRDERMREMHSLEAEYLKNHPNCGYFTDIMPLKEFPDYIDYLPQGSIAFKIPYLGSYIPEIYEDAKFIGFSREEFEKYIADAISLVISKFKEMQLV